MHKLLCIYSRSIRRIKLKYFLRYYEKVILSNYLKYKKLNNMFKKKPLNYNNSFSLRKKTTNQELVNRVTPSSYSYFLNKSEPFLFSPQINNKNMAYLMTPCYIIDNDEINYNNINQYNKKYGRDIIDGYYLSCPQKEKIMYRAKSSDIINPDGQFYNIYMNNFKNLKYHKKNNKRNPNNIYSARNQLYFPFDDDNNLFHNNIKPIKSKEKYINGKKSLSSGKKNIKENNGTFSYNKKSIYKNLFNENVPKYKRTFRDTGYNFKNNESKSEIFYFNPKDFTLSGQNDNKKILTRNRTNNLENTKSYEFNPFIPSKQLLDGNINKEILNHLYQKNYLNNNKNLKKKDNNFDINNKNNNKYDGKKNNNYNNNNNNNIINEKNNFGTNTEKRPIKNYSIFNKSKYNKEKDKDKDKNRMNKSRDYLFPNNNNNNEAPYNKILNNGLISSSNFSLINHSKKKIPYNKDAKNINKSHNSNNSNTQSNNAGHPVSTNYSIGPGGHSNYSSNKDSQKRIDFKDRSNQNQNKKNKNQNNPKPPVNLQISPGIVDEYFRDSLGKKSSSNNSNRVSLQSLSDSKMMELAGHYGHGLGGDESSSDNYQMNNVIYNKKQYFKNSKGLYDNKNIGNKNK